MTFGMFLQTKRATKTILKTNILTMSNEKKSKVIGIDLGTGNSCVAVIENGLPKVISNIEGNNTTPSVVCIMGDEIKVGDAAKRTMIMNPKNTVSFIKRFMGSNYDDPDVQKMREMATYDVVNEGGKPRISIDGKLYSPEQISSMIIKSLVDVAKGYYGEDVTDVVITCPAWFNDVQRNATKVAAELAGLKVLRVINEPTAAILSSPIDTTAGDKVILVNDLGCGTEDVSVAEISEGLVEILASDGDVFLGGQNYDHAIVKWLIENFQNDYGINLRNDPQAYSRLVTEAEKAKKELSTATQTTINLPYITQKNNSPLHLEYTLTRAKFEALTADLTDRVVEIAKRALEKSGRTLDELDGILLVGGSSRIPSVQEALKKAFNKPLINSDFDEAVALGAAKQANVLAGNASADVLLLDVTPISLGIATMGDVFTKMIDANTTIPAERKEVFSTAADNQPEVEIIVLQGERPMAFDNKVIGKFRLDGILPAPRGVPQIEVTFTIDANGILSVSAMDKGTQKENHITIENPNSLSDDEIRRIKEDAEKFAEADKKRKADADKLNESEQFAYAMRKALDNDKITEDEKKSVNSAIDALLEAVKYKKYDELDAKKADVETAFKPISDRIYKQPNPEQNPNQEYQQAGFDGTTGPMNEGNSQFGSGAQEAEFEEVEAEEVKD